MMILQSDPQQSKPKSVKFSTIAIDAFNMELSVNPGGSMGPSVGLGGEVAYKKIRRLSSFDDERQCSRKTKLLNLYLSPNARHLILAHNHSKGEIKTSMKEKDALRRSRAVTNLFMSPATRLSLSIRSEVRQKRLRRGYLNLKALQLDGGNSFFCHEEIYRGWMLQPVHR
mmetsp:Transcript_7888/g.16830  ORF Transcript_7888/g.16830 Transcript_7888/m.16830 type:complete len:170 (-) Transcript_7888:43-552(-)